MVSRRAAPRFARRLLSEGDLGIAWLNGHDAQHVQSANGWRRPSGAKGQGNRNAHDDMHGLVWRFVSNPKILPACLSSISMQRCWRLVFENSSMRNLRKNEVSLGR